MLQGYFMSSFDMFLTQSFVVFLQKSDSQQQDDYFCKIEVFFKPINRFENQSWECIG